MVKEKRYILYVAMNTNIAKLMAPPLVHVYNHCATWRHDHGSIHYVYSTASCTVVTVLQAVLWLLVTMVPYKLSRDRDNLQCSPLNRKQVFILTVAHNNFSPIIHDLHIHTTLLLNLHYHAICHFIIYEVASMSDTEFVLDSAVHAFHVNRANWTPVLSECLMSPASHYGVSQTELPMQQHEPLLLCFPSSIFNMHCFCSMSQLKTDDLSVIKGS